MRQMSVATVASVAATAAATAACSRDRAGARARWSALAAEAPPAAANDPESLPRKAAGGPIMADEVELRIQGEPLGIGLVEATYGSSADPKVKLLSVRQLVIDRQSDGLLLLHLFDFNCCYPKYIIEFI